MLIKLVAGMRCFISMVFILLATVSATCNAQNAQDPTENFIALTDYVISHPNPPQADFEKLVGFTLLLSEFSFMPGASYPSSNYDRTGFFGHDPFGKSIYRKAGIMRQRSKLPPTRYIYVIAKKIVCIKKAQIEAKFGRGNVQARLVGFPPIWHECLRNPKCRGYDEDTDDSWDSLSGNAYFQADYIFANMKAKLIYRRDDPACLEGAIFYPMLNGGRK